MAIDILAVLDFHIANMTEARQQPQREELAEARAAVTELIERDRALSDLVALRRRVGDDMEFADAAGPILALVEAR
jgi:hypothetical protein